MEASVAPAGGDQPPPPPTTDQLLPPPPVNVTGEKAPPPALAAPVVTKSVKLPEPSCPARFLKFCYNKDKHSVLGRTALSWFKVLLFFANFYWALFSFFTLLLFMVLYSVEHKLPAAIGSRSLIGSPGLGYRPTNKDINSALIWFNKTDNSSYAGYVKQLEKFTRADENNSNYINCTFETEPIMDGDEKMCKIYKDVGFGSSWPPNTLFTSHPRQVTDWGPCTPENHFGYGHGKPCVLIRLNRIIDWVPGPVSTTKRTKKNNRFGYDISDIKLFKSANATRRKRLEPKDKVVCITCTGERGTDSELMGKVAYYPAGHRPGPCIPLYYFPYKNQKNYLSPFIFVHFMELPRKKALIIS